MADPVSEFYRLLTAHLHRPPETRTGGDVDLVTVPIPVKGSPTRFRATATCSVLDISATTESSYGCKKDAKREVFQLLLLEAGKRGFSHQSLPSDGKYHHACPADGRGGPFRPHGMFDHFKAHHFEYLTVKSKEEDIDFMRAEDPGL